MLAIELVLIGEKFLVFFFVFKKIVWHFNLIYIIAICTTTIAAAATMADTATVAIITNVIQLFMQYVWRDFVCVSYVYFDDFTRLLLQRSRVLR